MATNIIMQGRRLGDWDLEMRRGLLTSNPDWNRTRLSRELCEHWGWRNRMGRPKDMAARTLLLKLERAGHIRLPEQRGPSPNEHRNGRAAPVRAPGEPTRGVRCGSCVRWRSASLHRARRAPNTTSYQNRPPIPSKITGLFSHPRTPRLFVFDTGGCLL